MPEPNPTVRQRELGTRLRQLRAEAGLTVDDVAGKLLCSATKVSRLETGARPASLRDVRDLSRLYGLGEPKTAELMELAREARRPGWWTHYGELNLTPYIGFEQEASSITAFGMYSVPSLLQTTEYAEALASRAISAPPGLNDKRVEALLKRQQIFERIPRPRYRALLDEAVLHRRVGGRAVMASQLKKMLELAHSGLVTIQIIPFQVGAHGSTDSNFNLFEFDSTSLGPVVFVEGLVSNLYQERPVEVERYRVQVDYLRDLALNPGDSDSTINRALNESQENR